jgi:hypothetical protein
MRIRQSALVFLLLVAAWGPALQAGTSDLRTVQTLLFRAVGNEPNVLSMTGSKVVPPSGSLETGVATISYQSPNLNYNISHNVLGATTAAIRGPGYGYENGPVLFNDPSRVPSSARSC